MVLDNLTVTTMLLHANAAELELVWIPKIMERQTHEEVQCEHTIELNGIGLNGVDSKFISSLFKQINNGKHLSINQVKSCRRVLSKYARQYVEMSMEK